MTSIHYSPENYGLQVVGHLDEDLGYEFHILSVWRNEQGTVYWAEDAGCSCPVPFEDFHYNGPEDTNLETDVAALLEAIAGFPCHEDDKQQLLGWLNP